MLGCNHDITVWLRKKSPETGGEIFVRYILPVKCRWKSYTERNISGGTANISNGTVIIIPFFDNLPGLKIKEGDIAALGAYDLDVTGTPPYTAGWLKRLLAPNVATIRSVSYHLEESMKGKHLRLTGN